MNRSIPKFVFIFLFSVSTPLFAWQKNDCYLPTDAKNRHSWESVRLTSIGQFGLMRQARPNVPAHLHTGMDIKRPGKNYRDEPIFPTAPGKVISFRDDGPFAQIIIEHNLKNQKTFWSVYEHVAGIRVSANAFVDPHYPIARFMNKDELNRYGWQFDHFHFEIMKIKPLPVKPAAKTPFRFFRTYCLVCYDEADLEKRYYNPRVFLERRWGE